MERVKSKSKLVLNPVLLDRGIPPVFLPDPRAFPPDRYHGWADIWRYEDFQFQVWREFRVLTGAWPLASILLHEVGWLVTVVSFVAGLILAIRYGPLSSVIAFAAGVSVYLLLRLRLTDAVLLWEWKRSERRRRNHN
jgi:hypothetical protein